MSRSRDFARRRAGAADGRPGSRAPVAAAAPCRRTRSARQAADRRRRTAGSRGTTARRASRAACPEAPGCRRRSAPGAATRSAAGGRSTVGSPALRQPSSPPSSMKASQLSATLAARLAALLCVRAPERQWKITARPWWAARSASSSFESGEMADAGDVLARMLVAFPDVHQDRAVVDETLGLVRVMVRKRHVDAPFLASWGAGGRTAGAGWRAAARSADRRCDTRWSGNRAGRRRCLPRASWRGAATARTGRGRPPPPACPRSPRPIPPACRGSSAGARCRAPAAVRGLDGVSLEGREVECPAVSDDLDFRHGRTVYILAIANVGYANI